MWQNVQNEQKNCDWRLQNHSKIAIPPLFQFDILPTIKKIRPIDCQSSLKPNKSFRSKTPNLTYFSKNFPEKFHITTSDTLDRYFYLLVRYTPQRPWLVFSARYFSIKRITCSLKKKTPRGVEFLVFFYYTAKPKLMKWNCWKIKIHCGTNCLTESS